jgi:hypothetical protein
VKSFAAIAMQSSVAPFFNWTVPPYLSSLTAIVYSLGFKCKLFEVTISYLLIGFTSFYLPE